MKDSLIGNLDFRKQTSSGRLEEAIAKEYLKERREPGEIQKHSFAPSNIGGYTGACPRYWYLRFDSTMSVDTTDAKGLAIMKSGRDAHERIESLLEGMGILIDKEIEIKLEDPPIKGYLDVKVLWEGQEIIGEIKTTKEEIWNFRKATRKASPQHLLQILIYMHATGVDHGFLFYENRNTLEFLVIPVMMTEKNRETLEECLEWLRTVRKAWEDKTIPQPVYQKRNKICQKCPVFDECWSLDKGDLKIPKFEAKK